MQTCAGETIILCHKLDELHVLTWTMLQRSLLILDAQMP
jgi:hypothetical protein